MPRLSTREIVENLSPAASGIHTQPMPVATPVDPSKLPVRLTATVHDAQILTAALADWEAPNDEHHERRNLLIRHLRFGMEDALRGLDA